MTALQSEFLCEMSADLEEPQAVGQTPHGVRMIYNVKGGTIKGPKFSAEVLQGGADWLLMRPDGVGELDVRATARADDGELVYAYYRGILEIAPDVLERAQKGEAVDPSEYYFRTTPVFETASEKYGWLNRIISVGVGRIFPGRVSYEIYKVL